MHPTKQAKTHDSRKTVAKTELLAFEALSLLVLQNEVPRPFASVLFLEQITTSGRNAHQESNLRALLALCTIRGPPPSEQYSGDELRDRTFTLFPRLVMRRDAMAKC